MTVGTKIENVENGYQMTIVKVLKISYRVVCHCETEVEGVFKDIQQTHSKNKAQMYLKTGQWALV